MCGHAVGEAINDGDSFHGLVVVMEEPMRPMGANPMPAARHMYRTSMSQRRQCGSLVLLHGCEAECAVGNGQGSLVERRVAQVLA